MRLGMWHREEDPYAVQHRRHGGDWSFLYDIDTKEECLKNFFEHGRQLSAGEEIRVVKLSRYSDILPKLVVHSVVKYRMGQG